MLDDQRVVRVARMQGVRYVLEGSVPKGGNWVRITAQLIVAPRRMNASAAQERPPTVSNASGVPMGSMQRCPIAARNTALKGSSNLAPAISPERG
jgi:hypothetical protein